MSEQITNDDDFEASLLRGMEEMLAHVRGERQLRTRTGKLPPTSAEPATISSYDGTRVRALRDKLALSPQAFAAALNVSLRTVQARERDDRRPEGPTLRLLEIAEERPDALLAVVRRVS